MTEITSMTTRVEAKRHLTSLGIEGVAAEAVLRETAATRHAWRVARAKTAAVEHAAKLINMDPVEHRTTCQMMAATVLIADSFGVGGREGVSGDATLRHPGLRALGKGRKQATDGAPWTEAIKEAAHDMLEEVRKTDDAICGWHLEAMNATVALVGRRWLPGGKMERWGSVDFSPQVGAAWRLTIAREGLRRSLGLQGWFPSTYGGGWEFRGKPSEWARAVNAITEEIAQGQEEEESPLACEGACQTAMESAPVGITHEPTGVE